MKVLIIIIQCLKIIWNYKWLKVLVVLKHLTAVVRFWLLWVEALYYFVTLQIRVGLCFLPGQATEVVTINYNL